MEATTLDSDPKHNHNDNNSNATPALLIFHNQFEPIATGCVGIKHPRTETCGGAWWNQGAEG